MTNKGLTYGVVASGGMDSTTLVYDLVADGFDVEMISFDYGQRHRKELAAASAIAERLGVSHHIIDIRGVGKHLGGSALTDDIPVPEGHYSDESMKQTVVPNRNAIMLSIASGVAVSRGWYGVATAIHAGDHPIYPDCRPEFIDAFDQMARLATAGHSHLWFHIFAPYVKLTKDQIVSIGVKIDVPYDLTWSCYVGGELHCGRCGTCVERREAFELAGVSDPTQYAEPIADAIVEAD